MRARWSSWHFKPGMVLLYVLLSIYGLFSLFPFIWLVLSSFKTNAEIYASVLALPSSFSIGNYSDAWDTAKLGQYMINSAVVSVAAVVFILVVGSMASFVLARVVPSRFLHAYFVVGIVVPVQALLIPTFIMMNTVHLTNTLLSLILVYAATNLPVAVFLLVGFFRSIPKELEDAAAIDGASRLMTFLRVILPLSRPGLAVVGILTGLYCWNEYLLATVLISKVDSKTLPMGIYSLQGLWTTAFGPITAGLVVSILPILIVYLLFQEQVVEGLTAGAVVG